MSEGTLGPGEVELQLGAERFARRLLERALKPAQCRPRAPRRERLATRGAQLIDDPVATTGFDGEQVGGDRVQRSVASREQLRGLRV